MAWELSTCTHPRCISKARLALAHQFEGLPCAPSVRISASVSESHVTKRLQVHIELKLNGLAITEKWLELLPTGSLKR